MSRKERKPEWYILEMARLYVERAWSDQEMADRLETTRTNIWKKRGQMVDHGYFVEKHPNQLSKYFIDRNKVIHSIPLTSEESLSLFIAGRRLQQQTRSAQKMVVSALEKLAPALNKPLTQGLFDAATQVLAQEEDHAQGEVLKKLINAWIQQSVVRITHKVAHGQDRVYRVHPYTIEPAIWGDGLYLIGYSEFHNGIATFKTSRISGVSDATTETFEIPEDFDVHQLLNQAWGIWHTDQKAQTVRLKFKARVTPRVKETIWHPSQTIRMETDGGCIWEAEIAVLQEMQPWIRGWGSDVEVLEPQTLRESLEEHARRLAKLYKVDSSPASDKQNLLALWGKTSKDSDTYHPAVYHMLDVAHVAQQLLSSKANPRWRRVLGRALNVDPESLIEWLPWIIALHDIGKLSVPFQALNEAQRSRLEQAGFNFGKYQSLHKLHHTIVGRITLQDEWVDQAFGKNRQWKQIFLDMVAGHHGTYQIAETEHNTKWSALAEHAQWAEMRQQGIQFLQDQLLINEPAEWPQPKNLSAAIVALNGFTILCDWLGSDENYFKAKPFLAAHQYVGHSKQQARKRVEEAGFFTPTISQAPSTFIDLFGWTPRPLQQAIDQIPDSILFEPSLTIIESLTGEGKTEAAFTLARRIGQKMGTDEMYLALPTTATSNAMFKRFQEHLRDRLGINTDVSLIHGQAFLVADDLRIEPAPDALEKGELPQSLDWFAPKKRSLLSPFGVGTIDQAELSALNVKHNALRLIGLAGKVVILDEVHAYDTYMATIIEAMLEWLSALGTSVILLSATLPLSRRRQLVKAYTGQEPTFETQNIEYPYLLTTSSLGNHEANPPAAQDKRQIQLSTLNFAEDDALAKAQWLLDKIKEGGTACWITNIVRRSQEIFEALQAIAPADVDLELLHSQFPLNTRQAIETRILDKHGKDENGQRPKKAIVIGTQVLEQSLDLDFDLMVSDLAPIDLLLQRVGRVHRHPDRTNRSAQHPTPRFWINATLDSENQLIFGADKFYTEFILAKSWEAIQNKIQKDGMFDLPNDYRPLVEHVYSEEEPDKDSPFRSDWEARQQLELKYQQEAKLRLAGKPDHRRAFWKNGTPEFKDEQDSLSWMNAQTRYIERETITVIPLQQLDLDQAVTLTSELKLPLNMFCSRENQLELLQNSMKISNMGAVKAIKKQALPIMFSESGLLKSCYPLFLTFDAATDKWAADELEVDIVFDNKLGISFPKKNQPI